MARECKLIHINDGSTVTKENRDFHFVEEFPWTASYLESYIEEGFVVKQMVPMVSPTPQGAGNLTFYVSGFTFYLEREVPDWDDE